MRKIRPYVIAEISANHMQDINIAKSIIEAAALAGATAIKLQTFTADLITVKSEQIPNPIPDSSDLWSGLTLWDLMKQAETPLDWHHDLLAYARKLDLDAFSTPYHPKSVDFLCDLGVDAIKVSSFDVINIPLLDRIATTKLPVILSTGMANLTELDQAFKILSKKIDDIIILKCTSSYPCLNKDANLNGIVTLKERYECEIGFSDHTLGNTAAIAAATLGATVFEKHLKLSSDSKTLDSEFSLDPLGFKEYVAEISEVQKMLGSNEIMKVAAEESSYWERPSIVALTEIQAGEKLTHHNIGVRRPSIGLPPKYFNQVLGRVTKSGFQSGEGLRLDALDLDG